MSEGIEYREPLPVPLTKEVAEIHLDRLCELANLIPEVNYTPEDILADQKGERQLHNKWQHSLVVMEGDKPIAFVMGYEREAEANDQYPQNTLYVSELAVAPDQQGKGIARRLLIEFFTKNNALGFLTLEGELNYTIQTNSADWNKNVVSLYESFGFTERATKDYPNRTDVVLGVGASELTL